MRFPRTRSYRHSRRCHRTGCTAPSTPAVQVEPGRQTLGRQFEPGAPLAAPLSHSSPWSCVPSPHQWSRQSAEQGVPSTPFCAPVSHSSVPSTRPLPQNSTVHVAEHPAPGCRCWRRRRIPRRHPGRRCRRTRAGRSRSTRHQTSGSDRRTARDSRPRRCRRRTRGTGRGASSRHSHLRCRRRIARRNPRCRCRSIGRRECRCRRGAR